MITEPIAPGQSPIPVVVVEHGGMTTGELWLTASTWALTLVTLLVLLIEIHKDHQVIKALLGALARVLPPYKASGKAQALEPHGHGLDQAGNSPL